MRRVSAERWPQRRMRRSGPRSVGRLPFGSLGRPKDRLLRCISQARPSANVETAAPSHQRQRQASIAMNPPATAHSQFAVTVGSLSITSAYSGATASIQPETTVRATHPRLILSLADHFRSGPSKYNRASRVGDANSCTTPASSPSGRGWPLHIIVRSPGGPRSATVFGSRTSSGLSPARYG